MEERLINRALLNNAGEYLLMADCLCVDMTRLAYNNLRGWKMSDNEFDERGKLVSFMIDGEDVHVTWYPDKVFNRLFTKTRN